MDLLELGTRIKVTRSAIDILTGEASVIAKEGIDIRDQVRSLTADIETLEKVSLVLSQIGEERQRDAQAQIESLVTKGLQKIFGPELSFHVIASMRGKSPIVDFVIRTSLPNGKVLETGVLGARGGGMASVVGFLLRLTILLLSKDKNNSILILDETFHNVSASYLPILADFLKEIVENTGVQILMVTHEPIFAEAADKCYRFSLDSLGVTQVSEI